jgi:hypothetical protein
MEKWMTTLFLVLSVSLMTSPAANAQERGRTGLTVGYPASVGVVWQPSDGFALRPEVSFSTTSVDSTSTGLRGTTSVGVGLSGLFYVARWESLSTYVSPRFVYNRLSSGQSPFATNVNSYTLIGSFGTQYALNQRFGVFGEVGVGYGHEHVETSAASFNPTTTSNSWNTRTGIGVMLYF